MNSHKHARFTASGRRVLVAQVIDHGGTYAQVAARFCTSAQTVGKWVRRYRADGDAGLQDRSSRPRRLRAGTPVQIVTEIERLRRERQVGRTIAGSVAVSKATVHRILRRLALAQLSALDPKPPVVRYEYTEAGGRLHLDMKKLGKFREPGHRVRAGYATTGKGKQGWDVVHVAIDDYSRVTYVEILADETKASAVAFLGRAVTWFSTQEVTIQRLLTDNGAAYRSGDFRDACATHDLKHKRTRPYRPQTNGKAERMIQTLLREWAYVMPYQTSDERTAALPGFLEFYNRQRPHGALPISPP
jgi:transposase InsO family protein